MAVNVVLNGVTYSIPEPGNDAWGQSLTDYFVAQASGLLQKAGGTFSLTAEVDFGTTYGLKSAYFKSRAASPATTGSVRLGNTEGIYWRNAANDANLGLLVNASNLLEFNGTAIQPAGSYITALTGDVTASGPGSAAATIAAGVIVNSMISASASIAYSKLVLTGSIVNADISSSAAISRGKMATGTANHVLVNDGAGAMYSEAQLAPSRGGSGVSNSGTLTWGNNNISLTTSAATTLTLPTSGTVAVVPTSGVVRSSGSALTTGTVSLATEVTGNLPIASGGTGQTTKTAAFDALSPNSTKGDIEYHNGTNNVRLPIGVDGYVLTASSGVPSWAAQVTLPPGMIVPYAGTAAPSGWLSCNGSAVSRTTYAALFAAIGTTYGAGDGSTTFNLPNTQGVFLRGSGSQIIGGVTYSGAQGTTQGDQIQGHKHNASDGSNWVGSAFNGSVVSGYSASVTTPTDKQMQTSSPITDGVNGTPRTGSETRPANISVLYIIKT